MLLTKLSANYASAMTQLAQKTISKTPSDATLKGRSVTPQSDSLSETIQGILRLTEF